MSIIPERSIRLTNDPAYPSALGGYYSLWKTQSQQQLMIFSIAPFMKTWKVSNALPTWKPWLDFPFFRQVC